MDSKTLDELRELCGKATQGDWWIDSHGHHLMSMDEIQTIFITDGKAMGPAVRHPETGNLSHWPNDWNASYIVAVQPKVVRGLLDDIDRLNALVIERETVRIGQSLLRHDDQKQIDELVALGIQQDKDEIARLRAENERWRQNYEHLIVQHMPRTGDGCQEGWSRVVEARELQAQVDQLKAENAELRGKLETREPRRPPAEIKRNGPGWVVKLQNGSAFGSFETAEAAREWAVSNGFGAKAPS